MLDSFVLEIRKLLATSEAVFISPVGADMGLNPTRANFLQFCDIVQDFILTKQFVACQLNQARIAIMQYAYRKPLQSSLEKS